jgi:protoheme IX farnesyltransferase
MARTNPMAAVLSEPKAVRKSSSWIGLVAELTKARITVSVTLTAATGYIVAAGRLEWRMLVPLVGVYLLASGASALNQVQETRTDALMPRTMGRPIPSGRMDRSTALFVSGLLILLGMFCLASVPHNTVTLLYQGAFSVLWYNGIYTMLKRVTAFAVVPGSLIGSIPPLIGYTAAGGLPSDPMILLVAAFFFVWQVPHFWLLLLMWGDQYGQAGMPTLTRVFSRRQLQRLTFMWVLATAACGLCFPALVKDAISMPFRVALVCGSIWLALQAVALLRSQPGETAGFRRAFMQINVYALMITLFLSLGALTA